MNSSAAPITVIGANGLVGAAVCRALADRGAPVRAVVRRPGTGPELPGTEEMIGDFTDSAIAADAAAGASAVISTVHPMGSDRATQHRVGVEGAATLARAAAAAGVARFIHVSTCSVYDRSPETGDVAESSPLVGDDGDDYSVTKRDADLAIGEIDGLTRVLVRPPAILGPGATSVWNTLRPKAIRDREEARHAVADQTFAWVHVTDLAALIAELATGAVAGAADPVQGPVTGGCTPVNVAAARAEIRDYISTVAAAVGVDPVWDDRPAWTGAILAERARGWGWSPAVDLERALAELAGGLRDGP